MTPQEILLTSIAPMARSVGEFGQGQVDVAKVLALDRMRQQARSEEQQNAMALLGARTAAEERLIEKRLATEREIEDKRFEKALALEDVRLQREELRLKAAEDRATNSAKMLLTRQQIGQVEESLAKLGEAPMARDANEDDASYLRRATMRLAEAHQSRRNSAARLLLDYDSRLDDTKTRLVQIGERAKENAKALVEKDFDKTFQASLMSSDQVQWENLNKLTQGEKVRVGGLKVGTGKPMSVKEAAGLLGLGDAYGRLKEAEIQAKAASDAALSDTDKIQASGLMRLANTLQEERSKVAAQPGVEDLVNSTKAGVGFVRRMFGLPDGATSSPLPAPAAAPQAQPKSVEERMAAFQTLLRGAPLQVPYSPQKTNTLPLALGR